VPQSNDPQVLGRRGTRVGEGEANRSFFLWQRSKTHMTADRVAARSSTTANVDSVAREASRCRRPLDRASSSNGGVIWC